MECIELLLTWLFVFMTTCITIIHLIVLLLLRTTGGYSPSIILVVFHSG